VSRLPWDMHDKVVVITGGNSGIGKGFAKGIARAGGNVLFGGAAPTGMQRPQLSSPNSARDLHPGVDVSDEARVVAAMAEAVEEMGRVDGVIANAGMMSNRGSFLNMTSEAWHELLAVNQHGAFYAAREGARHMKTRFDAAIPAGRSCSVRAFPPSPFDRHATL